MGVAISGLVASTVLNEADMFEIEQAGVSKKLTKEQLRQLLFSNSNFAVPVPQNGDSLTYNGTDWVPGPPSGWRVVNQLAYTELAPASTSTITFAGGSPVNGVNLKGDEYFRVGDPVRVEIGVGIYYYGICTAVTNTLLTISGAILPLSPIISLSVGSRDKLKHVEMINPFTAYTTLGAAVPLYRGCRHRWRGAPGYLVAFSVSHSNTSATTQVNLKMNAGANVSTANLLVPAGTATTRGPFADSALGDLIAANVRIEDKQTITTVVPVAGGTGDYLIVCMTFVVP